MNLPPTILAAPAATRPGLVPRAQNGAGAGFPTPAPPDKRAQRHSMQDTQPSTAVPSRAIWRRRM